MFHITPVRSLTMLAAVAAVLAIAAPAGAKAGHAGQVTAHGYIDDTDQRNFIMPEVDDEVLVMERRADGIIGILIGL